MKKLDLDYMQGDICQIDFNPTIRDEIQKIHPAIILSGDFSIGLDLRIVAPITSWKTDFEKIWWLVKLEPDSLNGLDSVSAVNCFQLRCISLKRIIKKLGSELLKIDNIVATSQNCIEVM